MRKSLLLHNRDKATNVKPNVFSHEPKSITAFFKVAP
jgi:hypothetical protein